MSWKYCKKVEYITFHFYLKIIYLEEVICSKILTAVILLGEITELFVNYMSVLVIGYDLQWFFVCYRKSNHLVEYIIYWYQKNIKMFTLASV